MKTKRLITLWSLLVGALWITAGLFYVDRGEKQLRLFVPDVIKPITMGIRN